MRNSHCRCQVLAIFMCILISPVGCELAANDRLPKETSIANCEVIRPSGEYAQAVLTITIPGNAKSRDRSERESKTWTYVGGFRNGRMRVDDGVGLLEPGGWLELKENQLQGRFRRVDLGAMVTVDATIQNGVIDGTAQVGDRTANVSGALMTEAELARQNTVSKNLSWPASQGPIAGGCSAEWAGVPTIDDLNNLRMVWRCEESDIGRGMGNISRFMHTWKDASTRRTGSGCASPLVAHGKVFFKYFVPAPRPADTPEETIREYSLLKVTESSARKSMWEEAKSTGYSGEQLPTYAIEKMYQAADDILLCMDASTGKTLWKAIIKDRGINSQHHKVGPFDMSPAYAKGRVFALGMSGWLYAFDADNGEPLWEVESAYDPSNALLAVGEVVIAPAGNEWGGYDAATGKMLWKTGGGRAVSTLSGMVACGNGLRDWRVGTEPCPNGNPLS